MIKEASGFKLEQITVYILLVIFVFTEIIDLSLDYWLGYSLIHSVLQLILFVSLFIITSRIFLKYSNKRIKKLIPNELMNILKILDGSNKKGILINQRKMRESLNITKPTLKKRVNILLELKYIIFEEQGNHRYFILTELGKSIIG
jgi:hypothetical protein